MKKIRITVPEGLDRHAINAWDFVNVCAHYCAGDAQGDYDFQWFILNLYNAYRDEYEFLVKVTRELK